MSKLDEVRKQYEEADTAAVKLSAEYQGKVDSQVTAKAAEAQQRLAAYEAAQALLERGEEGASTLANHSGEGGRLLHEAYNDLKADRS
jgi:hypothetical protein